MNSHDTTLGGAEKVLLLGSTGLLGSELKPFLDAKGYEVITHSHHAGSQYQVDLTDERKVNELLSIVQPEIIVNLVGLTDVDRCETNPNQAYLLNVRVIENLAVWIRQADATCHLIQVSTDQVYDGIGPHTEDRVALRNYYAFSKYAGELAAASVPSTILRTNFFGRSHCSGRNSFTDWLYQSLSNGEQIKVFTDVLFNPLSMATLVEMIELVLREKPIGVFNLGTRQGMSKADFAFLFADEKTLPSSNMERVPSEQAGFLKAYRPKDMRMDCTNIERALNAKMPLLEDEVMRVARDYHAEA